MTLIPWWRHEWIRMREGKLSSCTEHLIILLSDEELRLLPAADNTQWKEPKASSCREKKKKCVCSEAGKEERVIKTCSEHYINHLGADWRLLNGSFLLKWKRACPWQCFVLLHIIIISQYILYFWEMVLQKKTAKVGDWEKCFQKSLTKFIIPLWR